jgi:hypothetical protein
MAIPNPTTTVAVRGRRPHTDVDPDADGYDTDRPPPSTLASGVKACISGPTSVVVDGIEVDRWQLRCDPTDLDQWDYVDDETTGESYSVVKAVHSRVTTYGLDHVHAELSQASGLPSEGGSGYDS